MKIFLLLLSCTLLLHATIHTHNVNRRCQDELAHTHTHTPISYTSVLFYSLSRSLWVFLFYSHSWQRLILLAWQRASEKALFICQQNIIMSFHRTTHIHRTPAHPGQPCQAAACCRQQNGLKNFSVAKHLRHVFNNVVYNVDFSPFSLPPLPPFDFRMDFHRMPFMGGPKKEWNAVKSVLFRSFCADNYSEHFTVARAPLCLYLCQSVCGCVCVCVRVCFMRAFFNKFPSLEN